MVNLLNRNANLKFSKKAHIYIYKLNDIEMLSLNLNKCINIIITHYFEHRINKQT